MGLRSRAARRSDRGRPLGRGRAHLREEFRAFACFSALVCCHVPVRPHHSGVPRSRSVRGAPERHESPRDGAVDQLGAGRTDRRFQPASAAGISDRTVSKLALGWAFNLGDIQNARAQPTIADGRVYVSTSAKAAYALNARSGCTVWTFTADGALGGAIAVGSTSVSQGRQIAVFGDQKANAYAVNAGTGTLIWKVHVDEHRAARITGSPELVDGVVYVPVSSYEELLALSPQYQCCSFRGSLVALDAQTGAVKWKTYTIADTAHPTTVNQRGVQERGPSGVAIWSSPTVDTQHGVVYVATGNNYSDPATGASDAGDGAERENGRDSLDQAGDTTRRHELELWRTGTGDVSGSRRSRRRFRTAADPRCAAGRQTRPGDRRQIRHGVRIGPRSRRCAPLAGPRRKRWQSRRQHVGVGLQWPHCLRRGVGHRHPLGARLHPPTLSSRGGPDRGGRPDRNRSRHRPRHLESRGAARLRHAPPMCAGAIGSGECSSRRRLLGSRRRSPAGVLEWNGAILWTSTR